MAGITGSAARDTSCQDCREERSCSCPNRQRGSGGTEAQKPS